MKERKNDLALLLLDNRLFVNFYWDFCAPGRPAHVAVKYIDVDEALGLRESLKTIEFLILETGGSGS